MLKVEASDRQKIFEWFSKNEITWKSIPLRAQHFGGFREAAVMLA